MTLSTYSLRLGPLKFITALGPLTEQLGDALEAVGSSLVAGERRPRPFALSLPVRADPSEDDPYAASLRMRRQVRQLMENTVWRMQGLPLAWEVDPDLDCWLLVGGGDLTDPDNAGITFGEWKLELTDCYIAGRPGTHRAGRRMEMSDRRSGVVPRTSFDRIYSTDYSSTAIGTYNLKLPGDTIDQYVATGYSNGPTRGDGRRVFTGAVVLDGGVVSYEPNPDRVPVPAHVLLDEPGQVRLWDTGEALGSSVGIIAAPTAASDQDPDVGYAWERVLGPMLKVGTALSVDNGLVRCRWTGDALTSGMLIERWDNTDGYVPVARVVGYATVRRIVPVEVTPERVVIEWDVYYSGSVQRNRLILQRGWYGPRIEMMSSDPTGLALVSIALDDNTAGTWAAETPTFVSAIRKAGATVLRVAASHIGAAVRDAGSVATAVAEWTESGFPAALALQTAVAAPAGAPSAAEVAALSLIDAQSVPVLVDR